MQTGLEHLGAHYLIDTLFDRYVFVLTVIQYLSFMSPQYLSKRTFRSSK